MMWGGEWGGAVPGPRRGRTARRAGPGGRGGAGAHGVDGARIVPLDVAHVVPVERLLDEVRGEREPSRLVELGPRRALDVHPQGFDVRVARLEPGDELGELGG